MAADIVDAARALAAERGLDNTDFTVADVHALDFPDDSFDVVHAHQVLQHVGDPVQALREMRRVCRPGGIVAVRDSDYGSFSWFPEVAAARRLAGLYQRVARANGGEPDAGRRLLSWARAAGFDAITADRRRLVLRHVGGPRMVERAVGGPYDRFGVRRRWRSTAVTRQLEQLTAIAEGWREWGSDEDAWFLVPHGELLCRA